MLTRFPIGLLEGEESKASVQDRNREVHLTNENPEYVVNIETLKA
jgi:hypothetical protein